MTERVDVTDLRYAAGRLRTHPDREWRLSAAILDRVADWLDREVEKREARIEAHRAAQVAAELEERRRLA